MRVVLPSFGGITPRYSAHALSRIGAEVAHDVKLRNGRIEPWRERCPYAEVGEKDSSFHQRGCCIVSWPEVVQAADAPPDWGRFYITGRRPYLEAVELSCKCVPTYYRVGVPTPLNPPKVQASEECDRSADARAYVYTYVNKWHEESAPSPASNIVRVSDGSAVRVSGIEFPPDGYGITSANIYRASTGWQQVDGKVQTPQSEFLYVATIQFPTTTFQDNVRLAYLGQPLDTQKVRQPPAGLQNVVSIDGVVRLAGTTKNNIHVSENFQLHNWPIKYDLTLDSTIIHMGQLDQRLYVTTDTIPYIVDVSSCEDVKCTPVTDIQGKLPDISCGHSSSFVMTPHGMIYASSVGVILIDPQARWHILTSRWFSQDDWAKVEPHTARFAYWQGYLFVATDTITFLLDINGEPYQDMDGAELSTLSDSPVDMKVSSTGELLMLEGGTVYLWNGGAEYRPYQWISRQLTGGPDAVGTGQLPAGSPPLGCMWSPVSAKIRTTGTDFTLITPRNRAAYTRYVTREDPFRLPRIGRHMWYQVKLSGINPVEFVDLGTAHFTVNEGA